MDARITGWQEPSKQTMQEASEMIDVMSMPNGPDPMSAVENGVRLHLQAHHDGDVPTDRHEREGLVKAVARVIEADADTSRAKIGTLDAARMIGHDVGLQYEAALISQAGVSRISSLLRGPASLGRDSELSSLPGVRYHVEAESDSQIAAIAAGDFHRMSPSMSIVTRAAIDSTRTPSTRASEVHLLHTAGLIDGPTADDLHAAGPGLKSRAQIMTMVKANAEGERRDRAEFGVGNDVFRETPAETATIGQRVARSYVQVVPKAHAERARVIEEAIRVLEDSKSPLAGSQRGRGVVDAIALLEVGGTPVDRESDGFKAAVLRSIQGVYGMPGEAGRQVVAARITADMRIQQDAARLLRVAEIRQGRTALDASTLKALGSEARRPLSGVHTSSARDIPDLKLLAEGRFDEISRNVGIRQSIDAIIENAGTEAARKVEMSDRVGVLSAGPQTRAKVAARAEFGRSGGAKGPRSTAIELPVPTNRGVTR